MTVRSNLSVVNMEKYGDGSFRRMLAMRFRDDFCEVFETSPNGIPGEVCRAIRILADQIQGGYKFQGTGKLTKNLELSIDFSHDCARIEWRMIAG